MNLAAEVWPLVRQALPWLVLAAALIGSGFYSGSETGAYRVNRVRLRLASSRGDRRAQLLDGLLHDMPGLIVVILIGNNIVNYVATAIVSWMLHTSYPDRPAVYAELLATLIMAPALFVFGEVLPKNIASTEADRLMYRAARPLWLSSVIFRWSGLVSILKGISLAWTRLMRRKSAADPFPARGRLRGILRESAAEGVVTAYQNELVDRILNLHQVNVSQAMIPARNVSTVPPEMPTEQFRQTIETQHFSWLPVIDPRTHEVLGILPVHRVLREADLSATRLDLRPYLQKAFEVGPDATIAQALFALQRQHSPMAIVRNARGQFIGMITAKDLVEEIVGELEAG